MARIARLLTIGLAVGLGMAAGACSDHGDDAHHVIYTGCDANGDCSGGRCIDGFPGGLCTRNCARHEDCPSGTLCVDTESIHGVCLFPCATDGECVDTLGGGYTCDTESDVETEEDVLVCVDA
ncbi:MAG: hypothetical protein D6705_04625 [Deltaproteobacteria bacterium]|nr:MAG: hypothetical protein D6705_04625 [Deltaproteobacteria bacterium]